jgi:Undecaprenyl-phosphate galactose phosphotransferase WbaP
METTGTELKQVALASRRDLTSWRGHYAQLMMTGGMVTSDVLALFMAGVFAVTLRWLVLGPFNPDLIVWFGPTVVLMVILFGLRKLYPGIGLGVVEEFRSLTIAISLMFIIVSVIALALHKSTAMSRFVFVLFWIASMVSIPALRRVTRHAMTITGLWGVPVVIIGPADDALRLYKQLKAEPKIGLKPAAVAVTQGEIKDISRDMLLCTLDQLELVCQKKEIHMAAVLYGKMDEVEGIAAQYRENFEHLILFNTNVNNHYLNKVKIQLYGNLVSLSVHQPLLDPWAQAIKRAMDLLIAGIALILLLPFFLIVAGMIWLDSPGPIFYRQIRLGKGGKTFSMLKLRTMYGNADQVLENTLKNNPDLKQEWETYQKLKDDPRITRIGKLLRRFSIDELAQLWNVLKGEMSLVGPRPIMPFQRESYGEGYQHYVRVAPGISGLWQINGRNEVAFDTRTEMDMEYVISWSVWLDIYIIIRTVWVVLRSNGAY